MPRKSKLCAARPGTPLASATLGALTELQVYNAAVARVREIVHRDVIAQKPAGALTVKEIAKAIGMSMSVTQTRLRKLVEDGVYRRAKWVNGREGNPAYVYWEVKK